MKQQQKRGEVIILSPAADIRSILESGLKDERYRVVLASTAEEAAVAARSASAEMAVVDSQCGATLELMGKLRKINPALGFCVLIGEEESSLAVESARVGAYDFFVRPLIDVHRATFRLGVALDKHSRALEERAYTVALEERLNNRTAEVMDSRDRIKTQFINTIRALEKALQAKNVYTEGHSRRVAEKSVEIARAMKVPREQIRHIELGALFHDIGKIGIRDDVLNKPSKLTDSEYQHMKQHPIVAEQILSPIEELRPIVDIVKHEHERWDGAGYPMGLKGTQIPLGSRLIAITDAWDSMVFDRIYRKALPHDVALAEIERNSGTQFDPDCVKIFCALERARLKGVAAIPTSQSLPEPAGSGV